MYKTFFPCLGKSLARFEQKDFDKVNDLLKSSKVRLEKFKNSGKVKVIRQCTTAINDCTDWLHNMSISNTAYATALLMQDIHAKSKPKLTNKKFKKSSKTCKPCGGGYDFANIGVK